MTRRVAIDLWQVAIMLVVLLLICSCTAPPKRDPIFSDPRVLNQIGR